MNALCYFKINMNKKEASIFFFLQLALAEKNGIKNVCRATPDVVICHSSSSRIQIYVRKFKHAIYICWGTLWRSWLRHCARSWKVAGSIPDGVIGIFHSHNPSGRTVSLGLTQPLTEMRIRNTSWR